MSETIATELELFFEQALPCENTGGVSKHRDKHEHPTQEGQFEGYPLQKPFPNSRPRRKYGHATICSLTAHTKIYTYVHAEKAGTTAAALWCEAVAL